jgi:hypothetical protein
MIIIVVSNLIRYYNDNACKNKRPTVSKDPESGNGLAWVQRIQQLLKNLEMRFNKFEFLDQKYEEFGL